MLRDGVAHRYGVYPYLEWLIGLRRGMVEHRGIRDSFHGWPGVPDCVIHLVRGMSLTFLDSCLDFPAGRVAPLPFLCA